VTPSVGGKLTERDDYVRRLRKHVAVPSRAML